MVAGHPAQPRSFLGRPEVKFIAVRNQKGSMMKPIVFIATALALSAAPKPRARDLGVPFDGTPGTLNAITDVRGVEVGETTLIRGEGVLKAGQGPVRTGVTVIIPRGKRSKDPVFAGWFSLKATAK